MINNDSDIQAAKVLADAEAILITAGAGIGVDSGLPDFRGNEGFWKAYPPIARLGISFYDMANPEWFYTNPKLAWAFYGHRLNLYRTTAPHQGFFKLLAFAQKKADAYFVFTSNVDGQFQKAGYNEHSIEECHGSIHHLQCSKSCSNRIWSAEDLEIVIDEEAFQAREPFPHCRDCGAIARPNILMFGDWSWISDRTRQQDQNLQLWVESIKTSNLKLAVVEIGAGKAVPTVRHLSENIANQCRAPLIRINPRDSEVPPGHLSIPAGAMEGIDRIFKHFI